MKNFLVDYTLGTKYSLTIVATSSVGGGTSSITFTYQADGSTAISSYTLNCVTYGCSTQSVYFKTGTYVNINI